MKPKLIKHLNHLGIMAIILSSLALLEDQFFISDLLVSFQFQYLWFFFILLIINLVAKKTVFLILYFSMFLIHFHSIYPTWFNVQELKDSDLKIYFSNVHTSNKHKSLLIESILEKKPDMVILQEVNKRWEQELISLDGIYKHKILLTRENNFGMAIFSHFKILDQKILRGKAQIDSILFKVKLKKKDIHILSTHLMPPINLEYWRLRNNQFKELQDYLNKTEGEKILVGDLNTVPWSPHLRQLSQNTGLDLVHTFRDTWNSAFPIGMRIRLDHALISKGLKGTLNILNHIGSDHLPMLLKIKISDQEEDK